MLRTDKLEDVMNFDLQQPHNVNCRINNHGTNAING